MLFILLAAISPFLWVCCAAAPQNTSVTVNMTFGTSYEGLSIGSLNMDQFLGIPYAQQPVGNLRFKAPLAITNHTKGVVNVTQFGNACPQPGGGGIAAQLNIGSLNAGSGEDCLVLNVFRPTGTNATDKLPVVVWIYGGAYNIGTASDPTYYPTRFIQRSVAMGKPIIFVSVNYRVNTFGFLASRYVPAEDLNAGLQDQRMAFQFVKQNIASFGGDPSKVTCGGQSAGAGSCEFHVLYPAKERHFRSVIAESSTGPFKSAPYAYQYDEPGKPFATIVNATGCPLSSESVACLRNVSLQTLSIITNALIGNSHNYQFWEPAVGPRNSIIPERPSQRIASGNFLHDVAYLGGTTLNEGTLFSQFIYNFSNPNITEDQAFNYFIGQIILDNTTLTSDVLKQLDALYPANDSTAGGPYHTGNSLFDRSASWFTDAMFLGPRRMLFDKAAAMSSKPFYGYHFTEFIPTNTSKSILGVYHASELQLLFGPVPSVEQEFADTMLTYWINFIVDQNPGGGWPRFTSSSKKILQLQRNNITVINDDYHLKQTNAIKSLRILNELEK